VAGTRRIPLEGWKPSPPSSFLASGSPQRVNGKVKGRIFVGSSQVPVVFENTDLHSYVVMNHGRSYTAISTIPETLGYSLLPLAPIGGIIGWMFAVEQDGFKNGFSMTGNLQPT
jgi:nidogen (entactin)